MAENNNLIEILLEIFEEQPILSRTPYSTWEKLNVFEIKKFIS